MSSRARYAGGPLPGLQPFLGIAAMMQQLDLPTLTGFLNVGPAARELGEHPQNLSVWLSRNWFDESRCPSVAGRRLIDPEYLPTMKLIISRRKGMVGRRTY